MYMGKYTHGDGDKVWVYHPSQENYYNEQTFAHLYLISGTSEWKCVDFKIMNGSS